MSSSLAALYENAVLAHPRRCLLAMALVVAACAVFMPSFRLDSGSDSLILEDDADLRAYIQIRQTFPDEPFLLVAYQPKHDLFEPATLQALRALVDELEQVDGVEHVNSMLNAPLLLSPPLPITALLRGIPNLEDERVDKTLARKELTESPFYSEQLISRDGETTAIQLVLTKNPPLSEAIIERETLRGSRRSAALSPEESARLSELEERVSTLTAAEAEQQEKMVADIRAVLARHRDAADVYLGGLPMIVADMTAFVRRDLVVFGAGMIAFLALALWIVFRSKRFVFLPLLTCALVVVTMIGLLGLLDKPATVVSSNFISLLLIIGMSMAIHIAVRFDNLKQSGNARTKLKQAVVDVALPCFFCSLTTMVGFGSLVFSGIKPVMDFGLMMTAGIAVAYAFIFLVLAPLLVLTTAETAGSGDETAETEAENPLMLWLAKLTDAHGGLLFIAALVLLGVSVWGTTRLSVENRFIDYFHENTEIHQGMLLIDSKLGGTVPLEIVIDGGEKNYWINPAHRAKLRQAHEYLEQQSAVGKVLSLDATLKVAEEITGSRPLNSFLLGMLKTALPARFKEAVLEPFVDRDFRQVRLVARVVESDPNLKRQELLDGIRNHLINEIGFEADQVRITGMYVLYNNMLQSLFDSQIKTIGVVFLAILMMFLILFRSFPVAIIALVPNVFPVFLVLGIMGLLGIPLDLMTITIAAVSVGIAVDHTIHYVYRFRAEFEIHRDYRATLYRCHGGVGRAMFYTSVTIVAGFMILAASSFRPTIYFGIFTSLAMVTALFAAVTLLPYLLIRLRPFGREHHS
ncbi:efflux RND transporter permease subunit [Acanthopleuribacter pedis]|uniref:RND family transporter n=1 Tax=Acanthopleuribacter pedis TaxID=442870 RepID=A0A8J7QAL1_9BACT|nr:MMPL family transporter [Acanthopleuribacter pedis]MBO1320907.1 RND family transporter [Acanthopleuribacter pedis]